GRDHQADPAGAVEMPGQVECSYGERRDTALHIAAAPTVQLARVAVGGEWIHAPGRHAERNRVDMASEANWLLVAATSSGRYQVGAPFPEAVVRDAKARVFQ